MSDTIKLGVYGSQNWIKENLLKAIEEKNLQETLQPHFFGTELNHETVPLSQGCKAIAIFINDDAGAEVVNRLHEYGVQLILCMSAGFNMVNLEAAKNHGITVARVPTYSPNAVAEYAVGMLLSLVRKIHKASYRTRECNFNIEGLMGMDLHGKTVGVLGTGNIGAWFCRIMNGIGCRVTAYDVVHNPDLQSFVEYKDLNEVLSESHVVALFLPLFPSTYHIINKDNIFNIRKGAYLVNVSRGGLIETEALIKALKAGHFCGVALDVYEQEDTIFYKDMSEKGVIDDSIIRLISRPNVIVSSHMAFFTKEAVSNICASTLDSLTQFLGGETVQNAIDLEQVLQK